MAKKPKPAGVKVYPVKGHYLSGVPRVVQIIKTKKDADDLIASGAFTDNPNDADRDHDVEDHSPAYADESPQVVGERESTGEPVVDPARTSTLGENPTEEPTPANEPPSSGADDGENG